MDPTETVRAYPKQPRGEPRFKQILKQKLESDFIQNFDNSYLLIPASKN
jgi:hypothetical protein